MKKNFNEQARNWIFLEEIKHNIKKMDGIIKRVLDFSRQSETATRSKLDVSLLIDDTLKLWRSAMAKDGIELRLFVEEDLPDILGDPIEIQQVLNNLVQNAVDAMSQGGPLSITAREGVSSADKKRPAVIIRVQDTGPGIPVEQRESIFNPFFTTKPAGTGLGLAISHRIVSQSWGDHLFREHHRTWGPRFISSFRLHQEIEMPETTVLVVDDDKSILTALRMTLEGDYVVCTAENGADALRLLRDKEPDVVLLDIGLPDTSGIELIEPDQEYRSGSRHHHGHGG